MAKPLCLALTIAVLSIGSFAAPAVAQVTPADYERAGGLREEGPGARAQRARAGYWIEKTHRFWYRRSVKGGNEFVLVDADTGQKRPLFDHEKLASTLANIRAGRSRRSRFPSMPLPSKTASARSKRASTVRRGHARWRTTACTKTATVGAFEQRQPPPARRPPPTRSPACRLTASGKRWSPTSTSPSARRAPRRSRCSAPTGRRPTAMNSTRWRGRPTRRSSRRIA